MKNFFMKIMESRGIKLIQQPYLREFHIRPDFYSPKEDIYYEVTSNRQAYLIKAKKIRQLNKKGLKIQFVRPDGSAYGPLSIKKVSRKDENENKNYMLVGISAKFWKQVRIKCISERVSIKGKILQLLDNWLKTDGLSEDDKL